MKKNETSGEKEIKKPSEPFETGKEKDLDELVHQEYEPNNKEDVGVTKGKDPDDLIHQPPKPVESGSLPDSETMPIDDEIEDDPRRE